MPEARWFWPGDAAPEEPLPVFIGETAFYDQNTDSGNGGNLQANRVTLEARYGTCTVKSLAIRVYTAAGTVVLGLYDDDGAGGGPGTLICQTGELTPSSGAWASGAVLVEENIAPGTYWIAHHPSSGSLTYGAVNAHGGSNEGRYYTPGYNATLPSSFSGSHSTGDFRWSVYATLESTTETYVATSSPPSTPSQASAAGFTTLAFFDDFDYYNREVWADHIFYEEEPAPDSIYMLEPSVLRLNSQLAEGHPDTNIAEPATTAGGGNLSFLYGYFECRMKYSIDEGCLPAFWLAALSNALNENWPTTPTCEATPCYNAELDIMEALHDDSQLYYGTLHMNTGDLDGTNDQTLGTGEEGYDTGVDLDADFHRYGCLWTDSEVTWYFDDVEVVSVTPFSSAAQKMLLICSSFPQNAWVGDPANAVTDLTVDIDYVAVWQ